MSDVHQCVSETTLLVEALHLRVSTDAHTQTVVLFHGDNCIQEHRL